MSRLKKHYATKKEGHEAKLLLISNASEKVSIERQEIQLILNKNAQIITLTKQNVRIQSHTVNDFNTIMIDSRT